MIARVIGEGIPVVLIHGFGVDHRIMLPCEDFLDAPGVAEWQRWYLDLPWAEGAVDTGVTSPRELAVSVLTEIRSQLGGRSFAIVGNSFGAMVARFVAHELADSCVGLATFAGVYEMDQSLRQLPQHEVIQPDEAVLSLAGDAREDFASLAVVQTPAALTAFTHAVLPGIRGARDTVTNRIARHYTDAPTPEATATAFVAPSLHLFGRQDRVVGAEDGLAFRHHYTRGTFVTLDAAGHNLHLERPEVVGALLRDWLDRVAFHAAAAQIAEAAG